MKKTIVALLAVALIAPAAVFAMDRTRDTADKSAEEIITSVALPWWTNQERIDLLTVAVMKLQEKIVSLLKQQGTGIPKISVGTTGCFVPMNDLYMGRTDALTGGEVSKLQLWLKAEGYFADAQGTGYYGAKTADAVMRWQKAHGMDFVTLTSGVGKQTRSKMQEACIRPVSGTIQGITWKASVIDPNAESYQAYEQNIVLGVLYKDGSTKTYKVGSAYGCPTEAVGRPTFWEGKNLLGSVSCYYALSGTQFIAYLDGQKLIVEKGIESAKDGSVLWTRVLETGEQPAYPYPQQQTITGEYGYSDMSGFASFNITGPYMTGNGGGTRPATLFFGQDNSTDAYRAIDPQAHAAIAGSLSPLGDSCSLIIEATIKVHDLKPLTGKGAGMNQSTAVFDGLVSKGKVYDSCADFSQPVNAFGLYPPKRTERK